MNWMHSSKFQQNAQISWYSVRFNKNTRSYYLILVTFSGCTAIVFRNESVQHRNRFRKVVRQTICEIMHLNVQRCTHQLTKVWSFFSSVCWNSIFIHTSRGRYYFTKLRIKTCLKFFCNGKKTFLNLFTHSKIKRKKNGIFLQNKFRFFSLLSTVCAFMRSSSFFLNGWRSATQIKCSDKQTNIEWFLFLFHFASQYNLRLRWHSSVLEFQLILSAQIINFQFWNAHF